MDEFSLRYVKLELMERHQKRIYHRQEKRIQFQWEVGQQQLCHLDISVIRDTIKKYTSHCHKHSDALCESTKKISGHQLQKYKEGPALSRGGK